MGVSLRKNIWQLYSYAKSAVRWSRIGEIRLGKATAGSLVDRVVRHLFLRGLPSTATIPGTSMYLSDAGPAILELAFGIYEPLTTNLFRAALSEGMTVVDVGANVGYYTLLAASRVGPRGCVYAFEPHPQNFQSLQQNLSRNSCTNVIALPCAVSDFDGEASLYLHRSSGEHSLHRRDPGLSSIRVRTLTLDSFFSDRGWPKIDLIKMDAEGSESAILKGAEATIQRSKPALITEFTPDNLAAARVPREDFLAQLWRLGFSVVALDDSSLRSAPIDSFADLRRRFGEHWSGNLFCVGAFATAIPSLLRDTDRRQAMCARAKKLAQRFSCGETAREMLLLYERWLRSLAEPRHDS